MLRNLRRWIIDWCATPVRYGANHTTLGLPTRCWCGWHWSGYLTPTTMGLCNAHSMRHLEVVGRVNHATH